MLAYLRQLRLDEVVDAGIQRLVGQAMVVQPERVAARWRGEWPIYRCLAAALGVTRQVVGEEADRLAEVVAQRPDAQDLTGLLLDRLGPLAPDHPQCLAHAALD